MSMARTDPVVRFEKHVQPQGDCWIWTGSNNGKYGKFRPGGLEAQVYAHRWAYEFWVGPIPEGHEIDHRCRTPLCVFPQHLEPELHRDNTLRGSGASAKHLAATECANGHPKTPENRKKDGRCRQCNIEWQRRRYREVSDSH